MVRNQPTAGGRPLLISRGSGLYLVFVGWTVIGLSGLLSLSRTILVLGALLFLVGAVFIFLAHRRGI